MTLVQSWIDSLTLLKPKNAQLFIMVTVKSIIETYKLIRYWWWVISLVWICFYAPILLRAFDFVPEGGQWIDILLTISSWAYQLMFFVTCMATRPSVMKKDYTYFRAQMPMFLYLVLFLIFFPKVFWPGSLSQWHIFLVLFFADSDRRPKNFIFSMWYSLKMIIYNYPLLVIMGICLYLPVLLFNNILFVNLDSPNKILAMNFMSSLVLPIGICTYANVYIKKLHDQFDLYFAR